MMKRLLDNAYIPFEQRDPHPGQFHLMLHARVSLLKQTPPSSPVL